MTVQSTDRRAGPYTGNGVVTAFPFAFSIFAKTDVQVVVADLLGAETTLVLDSDYSVTVNADQVNNPGGTVNLSVALANAYTLAIVGGLDYDQQTRLPNGGAYNATAVERTFDRLVMQIQQLREQINRVFQGAVTANTALIFPAPSAGRFLRWRADRSGLENAEQSDNPGLQGVLLAGNGDMLGYLAPGVGSVLRNARLKLAERRTPFDKGAFGDGANNDTTALMRVLGDGKSIYLADGVFLATPSGSLDATNISAPGAHLSGPGGLKVRPGSYYRGVPGAEDNYSYYKLTGDGAIVCGITFDGNGQASLTPYNPTGPNVQFFPVLLYGTGGGQKAVMLDVVNSGGHAVEAFFGRRKLIAMVSAKGHNGIVANGITSGIVALCMSEDATDSHYNLGGNDVSVGVGLIGKGNSSNGGGIDTDGGNDSVLVGSAFRDGRSFGHWRRENAQTGAPLVRSLMAGVLLHNNCNFPRDAQAEDMWGNPDDLNAVPGVDWATIASLISPVDTPPGGGYNNVNWVHPKLERASFSSNVVTGDLPNSGARAYVQQHLGGKDIAYAHNVSLKPEVLITAPDATRPPRGFWAYWGNINTRIALDSVHVPTQQHSSDGRWDYRIVRILPKSGMAFLTIDYLGGFCHDIIEVTLSQEGDTGYRKRRFVVRGANGQTPAILDNTTEFFGTAPPEVSIAPATSSLVIGGFTNASAAANGYACAIDIKILTPYDAAARFRPAFTY